MDRYFDPLDQAPGNRNVLEGITEYIAANDAQFLNGKAFDFVVGFSPDHYSVVGALEALSWGPISPPPAHPSVEGFIVSQAPITTSSILFGAIVDEPITSVSASTVVTKYDPTSVSGVWLASDPGRSGTNYYAGGQLVGIRGNRYLELGTPLPGMQTPIIVSYTPSAAQRVSSSIEALFPPDSLILPGDRWHSRYIHELYHAMSRLLSFNGLQMGDLYKRPARLERYDIMDDGEDNRKLADLLGDGVLRNYYEPSYLSGYSKLASQFIFPYTLAYGHNEGSIRLHKSEETDFANTNERVKLIKIPLRPSGDPGFQSMLKLGKDQQYAGEEYLLLEWRYRGSLGAAERNFDAYLPSEGLVITHVIHNPHYNGTNSTGFGANVARVIDATAPPLQEEGYTDTPESPALFGPQSGIFTFEAGTFWQETAQGQLNINFLLSEGAGEKTIYAKFKDGEGNIIGLDATALHLEDGSTSEDRIPSMSIVSPQDNSVVTADPTRVTINVDAPNEVVRIFVYHDGVELFDTSGERTVDFIRSNQFSGGGFHTMRWVAYDRAGRPFEGILPFYLNQDPPPNQSPLADAGTDQTLSDVNNDGFVTAVLDGGRSLDPDGILAAHEWYDSTGAFLSDTSIYALKLGGGTHSFELRVTDNLGATSADSVTVSILTQGVPASPSGLVPTAGDGSAILDWADNTEPDLAGYNVYRFTTSGGPYTRIATGLTVSAYTDGSVTTNYYYVVTAVDTSGNESANSTEVSAIPANTVPPAPPTDLTAGDGSVILEWADNTEPDLAGYNVHRSTTSGGPYTQIAVGLTVSAYTDSDVTTNYYYVVTAVDTQGNESANSTEVWAIAADVPPAAPTDLTAGDGSVILDWADNTELDLEGYNVYRSTTSGGLYTQIAADLTVSTYTDSDGTTNYYYVVTAVDAAGNESAYSTEVSLTPMAPPTEQVIGQNTSGGEKIEVKAGQKGAQAFRYANTGGPDFQITRIVLRLSTDKAKPEGSLKVSIGTGVNSDNLPGSAATIAPSEVIDTSSGSSFMTFEVIYGTPVGPLAAGTTYYLNLENGATNGKAFYLEYAGANTYANGSYHKAGSDDGKDVWFQVWGRPAGPSDTVPPAVPMGVSATAGDGQVFLDWADNAEADLAGYDLKRAMVTNGPYTQIASGLSVSAYTDTGVVNGTPYYYMIAAVDAAGYESAYSTEVSATPVAPPTEQALEQNTSGGDKMEVKGVSRVASPLGTALLAHRPIRSPG